MWKNVIEKYDNTTGQYYTTKAIDTKAIDIKIIDELLYELYKIKI